MATLVLPRCPEPGSECELEGHSPTSTHSSTATEWRIPSGNQGQHCARMQQPHRRVLRWLVHWLRQVAPSKQHGPAGYLPSGSSYDSLVSYNDLAMDSQHADSKVLLLHHQQEAAAAGCKHRACEQQRQQQQEPSSSSADSTAGVQQGWLRRAAKAVLRPFVHLMHSSGPQGPGNNDHTLAEQIVNVITCVPFFAIGMHGLRRRRCPRARHFSLAFMAVGVVAAAYHGAGISSPIRPFLRKMDYWTICYTSNVLRRAAHIPLPRPVQLAALLVAPVKPTVVTGLNLALVEGKFLAHALEHAHLRPSFKLHLGTALVGIGAFAYEDVATSMCWPPVLHSLWHCLSAVAMGCSNALLHHLELVLLL